MKSGQQTPIFRTRRLLPPIPNVDGHSKHVERLRTPCGELKMWSRYHGGCISRSPEPLPSSSRGNNKKEDKQLEVVEYLDSHRDFLETYVIEAVQVEDIERWIFRKLKRNYIENHTVKYERLQKIKEKEAVLQKSTFFDLINILQNELSEPKVMWELAKTVATAIGVDAYRVYKIYPDHPNYVQGLIIRKKGIHETLSLERADPEQVTLALEVASIMTAKRMSRHEDPLRFPEVPTDLLKAHKAKHVKVGNHLLYQPILSSKGKTGYVIEMWRSKDRFRDTDEKISSHYMVWGSLALHFCNMYLDKKNERDMSNFLLDVVKAIFEEMVSLDQLIKRILEFAQRLVCADRASLFLVDFKNSELVSTVFDLKFDPGNDGDLGKKEIRMSINRGIAGHVAMSGETMNIPDAYADERFNREVDETTGYKTISILCMPVKVEGKVIGVVQMVNKRNAHIFDHEDEVSFGMFSTFFGLALHHARLYERIMRKEQKYKVALEVLSYHNTCQENEVQTMIADNQQILENLDDFALNPYMFDEYQKCKCVIKMFSDLFDLTRFDVVTLTRFVLTVKKNYRRVPYHNFDHGWSVAHAMYVILKNDSEHRFDHNRRLALFVASLCHDLDHRGYTNKYMSETASPLAAMYSTSTLEHHHFNITVTILQQDNHNIFSRISSEDYKEVLGFIRQAILATDLAAFFPNLNKIKELYAIDAEQRFDWEIASHRDLAMAISMTAADLSASAKPWEVQIKTVRVIFEEFYDQGDKEKAYGKSPISMMDRYKPDEQPSSQVGFLSQICVPCFMMLKQILPSTYPMYYMALKNLNRWKARANRFSDARKIVNMSFKEEASQSAVGKVDDKKEMQVLPMQQSSETISWEEEEPMPEVIVEAGERFSGFWREEGLSSWIDEEGVVIETKAIKGVITNIGKGKRT